MLTSQPGCLPADYGTVPVGAVTHPAASGRHLRIAWQAMISPFARVADFFRRKKGITTWRWSSPAGSSLLGTITVIGLIASEADRLVLTGICSRNRWNLLLAETCQEARTALDKLKARVILCDRDLPGKGWREAVEELASSPHRACIILVSGVADNYLWNEVVRTGGFDVLSKPLREEDVVRAVRLAWSYWNSATRTAGIPAPREARES